MMIFFVAAVGVCLGAVSIEAYQSATGAAARYGIPEHPLAVARVSPTSVGQLGGVLLYVHGTGLDAWDPSLHIDLGFPAFVRSDTNKTIWRTLDSYNDNNNDTVWRQCPVDERHSDPMDTFVACVLPPLPEAFLLEPIVSAKLRVRSSTGFLPPAASSPNLQPGPDRIEVVYKRDLTPHGSTDHSWLRGVPGDTVTIIGTNWLPQMSNYRDQSEGTIDTAERISVRLGGQRAYVDGYTSFIQMLNDSHVLLHARIPGNLPAGKHPLEIVVGRDGLHDDTAAGMVNFDQLPLVEVLSAVTAVHPQTARLGDRITISGAGFSVHAPLNTVLLPRNHSCDVIYAEPNSIVCEVTHSSPPDINSFRDVSNNSDQQQTQPIGFQLTLAPLVDDFSSDTNGCSLMEIDPLKLRDCVASLQASRTELVTVITHMIWPSLHPMRFHTGAWRDGPLVSFGKAVLNLPRGIVDGIYLRLQCTHMKQVCAGWAHLDNTSSKSVRIDSQPSGIWIPSNTSSIVEIIMTHHQHGHQMELSFRESEDSKFVAVPSEWFLPLFDSSEISRTATMDYVSAVIVATSSGPPSICRSRQDDSEVKHTSKCFINLVNLKARPQPKHQDTLHDITHLQAVTSSDNSIKLNVISRTQAQSIDQNFTRRQDASNRFWSQLQQTHGSNTPVVVPANETWWIDADVDVNGLLVYGTLKWDTSIAGLIVRADWILVEGAGEFLIGSASAPMNHSATIFIKNSSFTHPSIGTRFLAGMKGLSPHLLPSLTFQEFSQVSGSATHSTATIPRIRFFGKRIRRTWSLLARDAEMGATEIVLEDDPASMGWEVGDEIAITQTSITNPEHNIRGLRTTIVAIGPLSNYSGSGAAPMALTIANPIIHRTVGGVKEFGAQGGEFVHVGAEVMNLQRSIVMTSDTVEFQRSGIGMHSMMFGGEVQMDHVRAENCGQRYNLGAYCFHMHLIGHCPTCSFSNNAVVDGISKGITIHGTHDAFVVGNVLWNARGVGIYVEDGNELNNTIAYNVISCESMNYCHLHGLDGQSEFGIGMYVFSADNHFLYNRVSAYYLTIFIPSSSHGQGAAWGRVSPTHSPFGTWRGNVDYGGTRFGLYFGDLYPRKLQRDGDGFITNILSKQAFTANGIDNGKSGAVYDHTSRHSIFVGGYSFGDIQFVNYTGINNMATMYWKQSKNFADGDLPHITGSRFISGGDSGFSSSASALCPSGPFTFIIENSQWIGYSGSIQAGQHCGLYTHFDGIHGSKCAVQVVLKNVSFSKQIRAHNSRIIKFGASGGNPILGTFIMLDDDNSLFTSPPVTAGGDNSGPPPSQPPTSEGNVQLVNATASYWEQDGLSPVHAIDGNFNTRWSTNRGGVRHSLNDWIAVELSSVVRIHSVNIWWEEAWAWTFGIFVRAEETDAYTFVSNHTYSSSHAIMNTRRLQIVLLNCSAVDARFVKIVSYTERLDYGTSIWEIEIIHDQAVVPAPTSLSPTALPTERPTVSPTTPPTESLPPWDSQCYTRPWVTFGSGDSDTVEYASSEPDLEPREVSLESEYDDFITLAPAYSFFWTVNGSTINMALRCTLVNCPGWLGIGFSPNGAMIGSHAIIGKCSLPTFGTPDQVQGGPDDTLLSNESSGSTIVDDDLSSIRAQSTGSISEVTNHDIREYFLAGKQASLVQPLPNSSQSIFNTSCIITATNRILRFSRPLITPEFSIEPTVPEENGERQRLIYAFGRYNYLSYHLSMGVHMWPDGTDTSTTHTDITTSAFAPTSSTPSNITKSPSTAPTMIDRNTDASTSNDDDDTPMIAGITVAVIFIAGVFLGVWYIRFARKKVVPSLPESMSSSPRFTVNPLATNTEYPTISNQTKMYPYS